MCFALFDAVQNIFTRRSNMIAIVFCEFTRLHLTLSLSKVNIDGISLFVFHSSYFSTYCWCSTEYLFRNPRYVQVYLCCFYRFYVIYSKTSQKIVILSEFDNLSVLYKQAWFHSTDANVWTAKLRVKNFYCWWGYPNFCISISISSVLVRDKF